MARAAGSWAVAAVVLLLPPLARADGAFPDELQVFVPAEFPQRIVLGTNFGLLLSNDGGDFFDFVCEAHVSSELVIGYQSAPGGVLFALDGPQLGRSLDEGCTWTPSSGGTDATRGLSDVFADPTDAGRVAVIGVGPIGGPLSEAFVSSDLGSTFGDPVVEDQSGNLVGVEYAASEPGTLYLTGVAAPADGGSLIPFVEVNLDGGWISWSHPELVGDYPYLAAVDPEDASELYLRLVQPDGTDLLAISLDRGATIHTALSLGEAMSAFARGGDGTLYVGARSGTLWVEDSGSTRWVQKSSPKLRCLGERAGILYGCGDSVSDGYALGTSVDQGTTWTPLLTYDAIRGLLACGTVAADCGAALAAIRAQFPPADAGPADAGSVTVPSDAGATIPRRQVGCSCGGGGDATEAALLGLLGGLALRGRRRCARTPRRRTSTPHRGARQ